MKPKKQETSLTHDMFSSRLENIINSKHELFKLSNLIDWDFLEQKIESFYSTNGRPGLSSRLIIGLHILKHMYNLSDEVVCAAWVENPYYQYFCGMEYFEHKFPIERSSMTHFRKRVGEEFCTALIQESLNVSNKCGALEPKDLKRVIVDTTVQPKAITFPTDAKLSCKAINALGKLAKTNNIKLRQSYVRVSKKALISSSRYRHAKQMKRAKKVEKRLKTWLGRMIRDIDRKIVNNKNLRDIFKNTLSKARTIYYQRKDSTNKIYSWHAPEVSCISKGKAHKPYEFGCKVSITTNVNKAKGGHFVLHAKAFPGAPYDGHTLNTVINELESQTGISVERSYVDGGYTGHDHPNKHRVFKSGQKRGITASIKKELRRRSVVEPLIGHLKNDLRLGRNYLHGIIGDKMNALMVAAGYNFKLLLKWLRNLFLFILFAIFDATYTDKKAISI